GLRRRATGAGARRGEGGARPGQAGLQAGGRGGRRPHVPPLADRTGVMTDEIEMNGSEQDEGSEGHEGDEATDAGTAPEGLFDRIRAGCATVAGHAARIRIDDAAIERLASTLTG